MTHEVYTMIMTYFIANIFFYCFFFITIKKLRKSKTGKAVTLACILMNVVSMLVVSKAYYGN